MFLKLFQEIGACQNDLDVEGPLSPDVIVKMHKNKKQLNPLSGAPEHWRLGPVPALEVPLQRDSVLRTLPGHACCPRSTCRCLLSLGSFVSIQESKATQRVFPDSYCHGSNCWSWQCWRALRDSDKGHRCHSEDHMQGPSAPLGKKLERDFCFSFSVGSRLLKRGL